MTAYYIDRSGARRCVGCSHIADHPVPCGARPVIGSRPCACPGPFATTLPVLSEAGPDSTVDPASRATVPA